MYMYIEREREKTYLYIHIYTHINTTLRDLLGEGLLAKHAEAILMAYITLVVIVLV